MNEEMYIINQNSAQHASQRDGMTYTLSPKINAYYKTQTLTPTHMV